MNMGYGKLIEFNVPTFVGTEKKYVEEAIESHKISGDGAFTAKCSRWLEEQTNSKKVLLTTSGSSALEMAAMLCQIEPGDEVIMPSYTFTSTANAFVLRGAKIVFVDIRPDTMNIDERLIEDAITEKTKAIVPVHYAGVACEMDTIMEIARKHHLIVVEDAAQGVMSSYKGQALGTIGDMGCYSFHETKNYSMGEGGAILLQKQDWIEEAEIIREKGTDRSRFFRGQVDKYTWVNYGSSYLPSEINAAYLWAELLEADNINQNRLATWNLYHAGLEELEKNGCITRPFIPEGCTHNAHMYYIKVASLKERTQLCAYLKERGIQSVFHYIPLHTSTAGRRFGRFHGQDIYTTAESERLLRLPMYYNMRAEDVKSVIEAITDFYDGMPIQKKKKIAIIGANSFQNPLIIKAKEEGYETHVFAWKAGDVGEKTADYFYPISIVEKEEVLKKCLEIGIDGITTIASDLAAVTVNYVAEHMNLACNSIACSQKASNKYQMRQCFLSAGIPTPRFAVMEKDTDVEKAKEFTYPLIVKPTDRSGSRAIQKIETEQELPEAMKAAQEVSFEHKAIVEEYIEGEEFSMEGISFQGKHEFLTVTRKSTTGAPYYIETGHIEPAGLSDEMIQSIEEMLQKALDALGVTNSATHSEFKITPDKQIRIIEIGARMGGDCIGSHLVELSTGYDYLKMVLDVALGKEPVLEKRHKPQNALIRFIMKEENIRELERVCGECPELIYEISPIEKPGSHIVEDSSTRYGYYILVCEEKDKIRWLLHDYEQYED